LIEYIKINIAKNFKNGESVNKLTTPKLIAYNGKMHTNNMIKSKSPKCLCLLICNVDVQIIDWIWSWSFNKNQTNTATRHEIKQSRARRRTTQRCTQTTKLQQNNIGKHFDVRENHLFKLKEKRKKMHI